MLQSLGSFRNSDIFKIISVKGFICSELIFSRYFYAKCLLIYELIIVFKD